MTFEIPKGEIVSILMRQIENFFPVSDTERQLLFDNIDKVLDRCDRNFSRNPNRYYHAPDSDEAYFNPFHSGQWTIFLYYLSNTLHRTGGGYFKG